MTIPAKGWLVLRGATGKRPTQHSDKRIWCGFGVQTPVLSLECPHGFGSEARIRYNGGLGGAKWEIPVEEAGRRLLPSAERPRKFR